MTGQELSGHLGVVHALADFAADELAGVRVDFVVHHEVREVTEPEGETRFLPQFLKLRLPRLRGDRQTGTRVERVNEAAVGLAARGKNFRPVAPYRVAVVVCKQAVALRDAVGRRPLEYRKLVHLSGNRLDHLDARGPRADNA